MLRQTLIERQSNDIDNLDLIYIVLFYYYISNFDLSKMILDFADSLFCIKLTKREKT